MAMNKKGISPLIATVLVIGFTIVLAGMIIAWGGDLFKNMQESQSKTADTQLACAQAVNSIDVSATATTLTIDNKADAEITGIRVRSGGSAYTGVLTGAGARDIVTGVYPITGLTSYNVKTFTEAAFTSPVDVFIKIKTSTGLTAECSNAFTATF